eukprot:TRINITY_DN20405_c0_g1_i1.p1 TRINITY_DN20405_c0_g1~~TRINITY_DN20405_c0_g1_i1.p1  ORF type:complete len:229 (+),score=32.41 TRINITY_DN20405_c0_g1_i1:91-777(+)
MCRLGVMRTWGCLRIWSLLLLLASPLLQVHGYISGDIVPTQRRGQFHGMRTNWHDVIGRDCPRFGINHEVVLPIPRPVGYSQGDAYKLALTIGREKFSTPWLLVMGLKHTEVPTVEVTLKHFGGELHGVTAKVLPMNPEYVDLHKKLKDEYDDPNHWPKYILIRYMWEEQADVDVTSGLLVLFGSALGLSTILGIYIAASSKDKLLRFVSEALPSDTIVAPGEQGKVD